MKKIYILFILSLCDPFAFGQQSAMLEKYRSMALEYSHDLKAAEKNLAASIELEKSARADLKPKLSGDANFQYTGNPLEINLNLPGWITRYRYKDVIPNMVLPLPYYNLYIQVDAYLKVSAWHSINTLLLRTRKNNFYPKSVFRRIFNTGIPSPARKLWVSSQITGIL